MNNAKISEDIACMQTKRSHKEQSLIYQHSLKILFPIEGRLGELT